MSSYRSHVLFYLIILFSLGYLLSFSPMLLITGSIIGAIYSLVPDLDTPRSKLGSLAERALALFLMSALIGYYLFRDVQFIAASSILLLLLFCVLFSKHRGRLHSLPAGFLMSLPLFVLMKELFVFAFLGYLSHLFLDRIC